MIIIDEVKPYLTMQPFGALILVNPGSTDHPFAPIVLCPADDAIMNHHQTSSPLNKPFKTHSILPGNIHPVRSIDH
jgi:hypothetical protein